MRIVSHGTPEFQESLLVQGRCRCLRPAPPPGPARRAPMLLKVIPACMAEEAQEPPAGEGVCSILAPFPCLRGWRAWDAEADDAARALLCRTGPFIWCVGGGLVHPAGRSFSSFVRKTLGAINV